MNVNPRSFSIGYSLLTKLGMLSICVFCLWLIGWPVEDTQVIIERKAITVNPITNPEIKRLSNANTLKTSSALDPIPLDVNQATIEELQRLPGIGKVIAQRIVSLRETDGPYMTVAALRTVPGIGDGRMARLRPLVTVE